MTEKINIAVSKDTKEGSIDIGFLNADEVALRWELVPLALGDLATELIALGLAKKVLCEKGSAYLIFNVNDFPEADFDDLPDYDVSG